MTNLERLLRWMQSGQRVTLTWDEDTELWECAWVTGGKRYTAFSQFPMHAANEAAWAAIHAKSEPGASKREAVAAVERVPGKQEAS